MAIYSAVPPPPEYVPRNTTTTTTTTMTPPPAVQPPPPQQRTFSPPSRERIAIDIDAWTLSALESLSVSPIARGTGTPLAINIDEHAVKKQATFVEDAAAEAARDPIRRPPSRRDSQRKREMLLKGKEGSRQRRRWENDRLIGVPNAQPPQPSDYEVHPTHPIHHIPYALATYWDRGLQKISVNRTITAQASRKRAQLQRGTATGALAGEVPRDLREQTKRSPAVRSWVKALEEPIRSYMSSSAGTAKPGEEDDVDSGDEEIVFSGRQATKDAGWKMARREVHKETVDSGMVLDSFGDDESASFKRWLTHSISDYYGLQSRSVILPNPSRKVVYVGLKQGTRGPSLPALRQLPRPLWEIC